MHSTAEPSPKKRRCSLRSESDVLLGLSDDPDKRGMFWLHELLASMDEGEDKAATTPLHNNNQQQRQQRQQMKPTREFQSPVLAHSTSTKAQAQAETPQNCRDIEARWYPPTKSAPKPPAARHSPSSDEKPKFGGQLGRAFKKRGSSSPGSPGTSAGHAELPREYFGTVRLPTTMADARTARAVPTPEVPDRFDSLQQYKTVLSTAVVQQIQLQLADVTERICTWLSRNGAAASQAAKAAAAVPSAGRCERHQLEYGRPIAVRKEGPNKGRLFAKCPQGCFTWLSARSPDSKDEGSSAAAAAAVGQEEALDGLSLAQLAARHEEGLRRSADVSFMAACQLSTTDAFMRERNRRPSYTGGTVYLTITHKEPSSAYAKDDVWVLFLPGRPERQALYRSTFHGPNRSLEVELAPLTPRVPFTVGAQPLVVSAVHAPNFSSEFKELEVLASLSVERFPLLPFVLDPDSGAGQQDEERVVLSKDEQRFQDAPVEEMIERERLNEDQARVLRDIVLVGMDVRPRPPVALVHGVFGSGKSTVLSASLRVLDYLIESLLESDPAAQTQILFAASTNAAVDRVLTDLFQRGFTSFLRVGSRRRIAKELFPFTLHCLASDEDDAAELADMLRRTTNPDDARHIRKELDAVRAGQMGRRREMLGTVRVVGATCTACTFDVLANRRFRIVVMDECSQTTEPTSLLAMANFGCERAVLVGDPQQLPPVLTSSSSSSSSSSASSSSSSREGEAKAEGLAKTLFERLSYGGVKPIMLRTQYRCHPTISGVANRLFYGGQLRDGVTAADRPPVVPGLPPVVLCRSDGAGGERTDASGSVYNEHEARAAAAIVRMLVNDHEVAPERIGVICLYRAQAALVRRLLGNASSGDAGDSGCGDVPVSTVDAFQGEERDVIVLSVARTAQLGFSDSPKRLNVAVTRARRHLIVVGHQGLLSRNAAWRALLQPALDAAPAGVQDCSTIISEQAFALLPPQ